MAYNGRTMNVVENIRYNVPLTLFCLLIILSGCNFREVLDDYPVSGVQITLDWTGVAENLPKTVRVVFYPKDAEGRKVDGYLPAAGGEMKVPPGHYAMIVYNYNTECVCIEGDECYGTIRAYTERCIGMDAGEDMIWSPDDFYVVALDDVEIAKSEAAMVMKLKPERVVSSYSFAVKVDGVENISAVVCYVSGLNGGYFLGRRLCTLAEVPVYVENDCKNGLLQGHPDLSIPGIEAVTGSLGQGLSIGVGMALAFRLDKKANRVYVIMGDGEQSEGQLWEAAMAASNFKLDNLTAFIDWNKIQATGRTEDIFSIPALDAKWRAFGWDVLTVDGHDVAAIAGGIEQARVVRGRPALVILDTVKGKGVSFAENVATYHNGIFDETKFTQAIQELAAQQETV